MSPLSGSQKRKKKAAKSASSLSASTIEAEHTETACEHPHDEAEARQPIELESDETSNTLSDFIKRSLVPHPSDVMKALEDQHGIGTYDDLIDVLAHPELSKEIKTLWRLRFLKQVEAEGETTVNTPTVAEAPKVTHTEAEERPSESSNSLPNALPVEQAEPDVTSPSATSPDESHSLKHADSISTLSDNVAPMRTGEHRIGPPLIPAPTPTTSKRWQREESSCSSGEGQQSSRTQPGSSWRAQSDSSSDTSIGPATSSGRGETSLRPQRPPGFGGRSTIPSFRPQSGRGDPSSFRPHSDRGVPTFRPYSYRGDAFSSRSQRGRGDSFRPQSPPGLSGRGGRAMQARGGLARGRGGSKPRTPSAQSVLPPPGFTVNISAAISTEQRRQEPKSSQPEVITPKAAGILCARVREREVELLLGIKNSSIGEHKVRCATLLGGPIPSGENPLDMACKNFSEEVGGFISIAKIRERIEIGPMGTLVLLGPKYLVHACPVSSAEYDALPETYEDPEAKHQLTAGSRKGHLVWVPWRELIKRHPSDEERLMTTIYGKFQYSEVLKALTEQHLKEASLLLDSLILRSVIMEERKRVDRLKSLDSNTLIEEMLGKEWVVQLKAPGLPPASPIRILPPEHPEYQGFLTTLPSDLSERIVSVSKSTSALRVSEFVQELFRVKAEAGSPPVVKEPLFYGVAERWRATHIALNGFDMNIKKSKKSGPYRIAASADPSFSLRYTGDEGSIVSLKSIICSNQKNRRENTIVDGDHFVFTNLRAMLPRFVAHFIGPHDKEAIAREREKALEQYKLQEERSKDLQRLIETMERDHREAILNRLRGSVAAFEDHLKSAEAQVQEWEADQNQHDSSDTTGSWRRLSSGEKQGENRISGGDLGQVKSHLLAERSHFLRGLPVYTYKPKIIDLLVNNRVCVITAETGSGKSTQLPQILLDDVFAALKGRSLKDERRVAVLGPRRVNATSLSRRVSEERGSALGEEVGYTIGRGESKVSNATRIEFMTHGLFVNIAKDPVKLLQKYCAVIVDEAHERSVDVDLSLALLKRALTHIDDLEEKKIKYGIGMGRTRETFRIIVTSATIGPEAEKFRLFLDPKGSASAILNIPGKTFPVYIEHREDAKLDKSVLGTAGMSKVLTSYAIQTAVDILQSTPSGNILVFLPGEWSIRDALRLAKKYFATYKVEQGQSSNSFHFKMQVSDTETDGESSPNLSAPLRLPRKTQVQVGVHGFHGKLPKSEKEQVLYPPTGIRMLIFATNLAETGLTVPGVRYVIDTGLERQIRWEKSVDVNEMVTGQVTLSSMRQRTGRAGRVGSGICIRLYPESDCETAKPIPSCAVEVAMIHKAVLLQKSLEKEFKASQVDTSRNDPVTLLPTLELMDPIPEPLLASAERQLQQCGALDAEGNLTGDGDLFLALGMDLPLARFLISCHHLGCLESGAKLASILIPGDASEKFLPQNAKKKQDNPSPCTPASLGSLIHETGDHLTLFNIVNGFDAAKEEKLEETWCKEKGVHFEALEDALVTRKHLKAVMRSSGLPFLDDNEKVNANGGLDTCLLKALCSAYYHQLAVPRRHETPQDGFYRVMEEPLVSQVLHMREEFVARTQPSHKEPDAEGEPEEVEESGQKPTTIVPGSIEPYTRAAPVVLLGSRSTLWHSSVGTPDQYRGKVVLFSAIILTDGSQSADPTVHLASYVSPQAVLDGAPAWCQRVGFDQILQAATPQIFRIPISQDIRRTALRDNARWLRRVRQRYPDIVMDLESTEKEKSKAARAESATKENDLFDMSFLDSFLKKSDEALIVRCPPKFSRAIKSDIEDLLKDLGPVTVVLQLPREYRNQLQTFHSAKLKLLETELVKVLESENRGTGRKFYRTRSFLQVHSSLGTITITIDSQARVLISVLVARVQSAVCEEIGSGALPQITSATGTWGEEMVRNPQLQQLLCREPPRRWVTRNDIILQLAHALIWKGNASLHGTFVRDWVARGETVSKIEVEVERTGDGPTEEKIKEVITALLAEPEAVKRGITASVPSFRRVAGPAVVVKRRGMDSISLVFKKKPLRASPSHGVDADVNNLLLNSTEGLKKRQAGASGSLASALENAKRKHFIYIENPELELAGQFAIISDFISKEWRCLNRVQTALYEMFTSAQHQMFRIARRP